MRVARISTVPYFVYSQLKGQIDFLEKSGVNVTVITSDGPELHNPELRATFSHHITVAMPRNISFIKDIQALIKLFQIFRRERFDIIHSTTPKAGLLSAIAGRMAGISVRLHTFTGQPWMNLRGPLRWIARRSDWLIGKLSTRSYADSKSQRSFLVSQRVIDGDKLFVIGNGSIAGVDLLRFNASCISIEERIGLRHSLGIPKEAPVLLFLGRITVDKGIRELMNAFREIKAAGSPAHLVLVGPFDADVGGVENGISKRTLNLLPGAHVVGYTERPETYLAIADVLCLPSYREGFGTVVIEAAAMGVPTIGTEIYGLSDAVANGETGILVPPRDSSALANALSSLLKDDRRRVEMGLAARRRAEALFDANRVNEKVVEEYRGLLDGLRPE